MTTQAAQGATIDKRETSEATFAGTPTNGRAPDFLALSQEAVQALPTAIYTTDAEGRITFYNEAAAALWGCRPELGKSEFCGSWKLYWPDGTPLPHDQCPMAIALKEGRPIRGVEAVAERPDGTRIPFIPYPTPLRDADGNITGAINMLVDISQRKEAETLQRILLNELNHRVKNNMQMLQSLISASVRHATSDEARQTLQDAAGRIAAMAAAQRALYSNGGASRFDAEEFVRSVCATARQTFPSGTQISYRADDIELDNDTLMPLALILNELLTNAVKYGTGGKDGIIRVALTRKGDGYSLSVEDDGPGFDLEDVKKRWSGLSLIRGLARQLGGQFMVGRSPTRCSVEFGQVRAS